MQNIKKKQSNTVPFPSDVNQSQKLAAKSWEDFVSTGEFGDLNPRSVICESWVRSWQRGLDPESERAPSAITAEQLERRLKQTDLGKAAIGAMEKLTDSIAGSKHVIVLADDKGCILHSIGHESVQSELEFINFRPGGVWNETEVGPNGIGTPLALGRPEIVMGHEHYCKGWQPWVCYGAPIPNVFGNKAAGVIDITGPIDEIRSETMTLAISLAQSIHSGLSFLQLNRRELLRSVCRDKMLRWPNDGVLVIDENGYIIDYNSHAARLMNLEFPKCVEKPVTQFLPEIWNETHKSMQQNSLEEISLDFQNGANISSTLRVRIEPILNQNENLGALLVVTGKEDKQRKQKIKDKLGSLRNSTKYTFDNIRGSSSKLDGALTVAKAAARDPLESNVLLIGETGTGKELIAHSIHAESNRANNPFIAINCGALPHDLIESELFGCVSGSFTGARKDGMTGKFEHASTGTLYLDEIDSLDLDLQAKFLRVLDHNEINRLGSVETINVDVRVIAAGSPELYESIQNGKFRQDLFHRISVLEIDIPSLQERGQDVIELAYEFLEQECWSTGRSQLELADELKEFMLNYDWPGNIRELHNLCRRWVLMVSGDVINCEHLPEKMRAKKPIKIIQNNEFQDLRSVNDELIQTTLHQVSGNISEAARILGINRTTIYRRRKAWENK